MLSLFLIRPVSTSNPSRQDLSRAAHACAVDAAALLEALRSGRPDAPGRRVAKRSSGQPYLAAATRLGKKSAAPAPHISVTHLKKIAAALAAAE